MLVALSLDTRVFLQRFVVLVEHSVVGTPIRTSLGVLGQDAGLLESRSNLVGHLDELKRQSTTGVPGNL